MKFVILNNSSSEESRMFVVTGNYDTTAHDILDKLFHPSGNILILTSDIGFEIFDHVNDLIRHSLDKNTYMCLILVKRRIPNMTIIENELKSLVSDYPTIANPIKDYYKDVHTVPESADHRKIFIQSENIMKLIDNTSLDSFIEKKHIIKHLLKNDYYYPIMYRVLLNHWKISFLHVEDIYITAARFGLTEILIHMDTSLAEYKLRYDFKHNAEFEAAKNGHLDTVQYLYSKSTNLIYTQREILLGAAEGGRQIIFECVFDTGDIISEKLLYKAKGKASNYPSILKTINIQLNNISK